MNKPPGAELFEQGNAYRFRTDGDRDDNLQRAIACYKSALVVVPDYARPVVLLSLGNAYRDRDRGSLEDLRRAVEYYRQAVSSVPADNPASLAWPQICLATTHLEIATSFDGAASPDDIEEAITLLTAASQAPDLAPERQETALRALGGAFNMRERGDRAANVEQALLNWNRALAASGPPEPAKRIMLLVGIATLNMERAGGARSDHVEAAITALSEAEWLLGSFGSGRRLPPILTLSVQQVLGDAYAARLKGDPAASRDAALEHHRAAAAAAEAGTPEWVTVTGKVARDLTTRLRGDASANVEEAIDLLRLVLKVLVEHDFSWAATMSRLGSAYRQRIAGDKAENIEQAIGCYEAALTVMTREASPLDWAQQQNNLGNAYAERLLGDRGDNLLQSAACLRSAVDAFGPSVLPQWSGTLANLALTYTELASYGEPNALRRAIECLEQALTVPDKLDPAMRATIQEQLGSAVIRVTPESPSAVEDGVGRLKAALQVFTADSAPTAWARIMNNLGGVQLATGNRDEAIRSLRAALTVRTREAMPLDWANTQLTLAEAYYTSGDHQLAEACLEPAAEVFRSLGDLERWRTASVNLAEARADQGDWAGAVRAFSDALEAAETSYGRLVLPASKEAELRLAGTVHAAAALAAVRAGNADAAAVAARWLESGRARILGDALARDRADLAMVRQRAPAIAARFEAAVNEQRRLDAEPATPRAEDLRQNVVRARDEARRERYRHAADEYAAALAAARTVLGRPGFLTTESPATAGSAGAPLVYLTATRRGGLAVILRGGAAEALDLPALKSSDLVPRANRLLAASFAASNVEAWRAEVDEATGWLWTAGLGDLADAVSGADSVMLVPCGALGALPLHAAWQPDTSRPTGRRYLLDTAPIAYAPSARVLDACAPLTRIPPDRLLAVADPQPVNAPRLRLSAHEAAVAAARLPGGRVLAASEATVDAVANALHETTVAHFACHGRADRDDPDRSGLVLAHDHMLDVWRIRAQQVRLRLAILSACETAQLGVQLPDEVVGLPAALMQAGAGGVLATWWPVLDDTAVALMLAFYERWDPASAANSPGAALAGAQQWLRDASNADIRAHLEALLDDPESWPPRAVLESSWENVILQDPQERPFAAVAEWGAFGYYGR